MPEIRIAIPTFDYRLNKNSPQRYYETKFGKSSGYKKVLTSFELLIKANLNANGIKFDPDKPLEITLFVYRPNKSHDPHNYVDEMFDIIQRATGVNDNKFITRGIEAVDPQGPDDKRFFPHFEIILKGV